MIQDRQRWKAKTGVCALVLVFALVGLGRAGAVEPVVLQLRWDHQFQFAGYYAALWEGFYADAGLDVEIRAVDDGSGGWRSAPDEVASGRATFGIGGSDILIARDGGEPLVVLASIFPSSVVGFYSLREAGIASPRQMVGRRVMRREGDLADVQFRAVLALEGLGLDDVVSVPQQPDSFARLAAGEVDVVLGYRMTAPFLAMRMGLDVVEIRPETYGVDFYGDSLFTHARTVQSRPEMVERFRRASLQGWRHALANPEATAERIARELSRGFPIVDRLGFNLYQADRVTRMLEGDLTTLGQVNPERWRRMQAELYGLGLVERPDLPDEAFFTDVDYIGWQLLWWRRSAWWAAGVAAAVLLLGIFAYVRLLHRQVARNAELLASSRWRLALAIDMAREGLFEWWPERDRTVCRWGGRGEPASEDDLPLVAFLDLVHPEDRAGVAAVLQDLAAAGDGYAEVEFRRGDAAEAPWFLLRCGMSTRFAATPVVFGVILEITRRKRAEERLQRLAMEDSLTGLANRRGFDDALARALAAAERRGESVVVVLLDLDGFKPVNDRLGHDLGDEVLRETALRLRRTVRAGDLVARFGGDEFALVLENLSDAELGVLADRILLELARPLTVQGAEVAIGASLGSARFPLEGARGAELVRRADAALYRAKHEGGGRHVPCRRLGAAKGPVVRLVDTR